MKASALLVNFHDDRAPIYSAHLERHGKGRLATAGGDNNVRIWAVESAGEDRRLTYLSTLKKHTQAVNVVRWSPKGDLLASAGDDGNILIWSPLDSQSAAAAAAATAFGEEDSEDKETWIVKKMCRSQTGSEIYDLAWSPDGAFFITGSMDNIARIFDAVTGNVVRQIAEHNHYVQGVAWDPLNEYIATQSSDRSVHVYKLKTSDGQFSLSNHGRVSRMDIHSRRPSQESPAPPDMSFRAPSTISEHTPFPAGSPAPSAPGTPMSTSLPMNPPPPALPTPSNAGPHSRRSSFGGASPSVARSASPAPSLPLPAVMPAASPNPLLGITVKNTNIYANETLTSFFRRLTFAPDGSLLFTPAGQYKTSNPNPGEAAKTAEDVINTVYIYSRGGLNKPPIAHLPGHKKPSVAVRCSPIFYNLRLPTTSTKHIAIDTSSASDVITPLPDPVLSSAKSFTAMEPPPLTAPSSNTNSGLPASSASSPSPSTRAGSPRPSIESESAGPLPAFALPYRIVYAIATQDAVYVYDTQQQSPICVVSNLHFATFTDLTWSSDGLTLLMSSSDGFCSTLSFAAGELGSVYHGSLHTRSSQPASLSTLGAHGSSASSTPNPTPTTSLSGLVSSTALKPLPTAPSFAPSPSPSVASVHQLSSQLHSYQSTSSNRPHSPTRSNSTSSVATQASTIPPQYPSGAVVNNPTPSLTNLPSVVAGGVSGAHPSSVAASPSNALGSSTENASMHTPIISPTPPMTPVPSSSTSGQIVPQTGSVSSSGFSGAALPSHHHSSTIGAAPKPVIPQKREGEAVSSATPEEGDDDASKLQALQQGGPTKKRRVAPTLVQAQADETTAATGPSPGVGPKSSSSSK